MHVFWPLLIEIKHFLQAMCFLLKYLKNSTQFDYYSLNFLRAAFKFGRGVHFALRRKMRKPPISRVPAILNGITNRPSSKTDSIYADIVK